MEKEEKKEESPEKEVYRISEADIRRSGVRQCPMDKHQWRKLSENEVICSLCNTALIISPADFEKFIKK